MCGESQFGPKMHLLGLDGALGRTCAVGLDANPKNRCPSCLAWLRSWGLEVGLHCMGKQELAGSGLMAKRGRKQQV